MLPVQATVDVELTVRNTSGKVMMIFELRGTGVGLAVNLLLMGSNCRLITNVYYASYAISRLLELTPIVINAF